MPRLRLTVVAEYDADPAHYGGTSDPAAMAKIDQESLASGAMHVMDILGADGREATVKVEPV